METNSSFNPTIKRNTEKKEPSFFSTPSKKTTSDYIQLKKNDRELSRDKEGMDFAMRIAEYITIFLLLMSLFKMVYDISTNKAIDIGVYTNFLIPILTTVIGFILGKKSN